MTEEMPEKKRRGRPPRGSGLPLNASKVPMPETSIAFPLKPGQVYKMTDADIVVDVGGNAVMMSILPFLVMKVTKDKIALRFPFGGFEVHRIVGSCVLLGQDEYDASKSFKIYEAGLFQ